MTSRVHGSSRGRVLPFSADDTAQNSMALRTRPWHFVPTVDVSAHTSYRQASQDHPYCVHLHVSQDPSSSNAVFSEFWPSGCSSPCSWDHSRRSQPVVNLNRCSQPVVSLARRTADSNLSFATLNANLERPPAIWQPALLMHSCISL